MNKPRRKKLLIQDLENALGKYERRIQKLAEQAYHVRQAIEQLNNENRVKEETENAVHRTETTTTPS